MCRVLFGQRHVRDERARVWSRQLDYSKMPNAKNLIPSMKYPYGIGHIYSGKVVAVQSKADVGADRLRRYASTPRPRRPSSVSSTSSISSRWLAAALASGRPRSATSSRARRRLLRLQEGRRARNLFPANEAFAQATQGPRKSPAASCGRGACRAVGQNRPASTSRPVAPKEGVPIVCLGPS